MIQQRFWSIASLLALFGTTVPSPVLDRLGQHMNTYHERQSGTFDITGAVGGIHPRLEIREMEKNAPLWNLFLAAYEQWQAVDQDDMTSFFQIAAIHGQPLQPWDGVESTGSTSQGYCPHDSNVFGSWHRPYMAVFEQLLQAQAIKIADSLPDGDAKEQYQSLAQQLRMPYWDWAINPPDGGTILPTSVSTETTSIAYPNGTTAKRPNPLYQYKFHPLQQGWFGGRYAHWDRTVRNPVNINDYNSPSVNSAAESELKKNHASRRDALYNILTQHQTFNQFSNHGSGDSPVGSLETIHDGVHTAFGEGHMTYLSISAFDPVFWLHHANIDRLITLFQYIYPDTWIEPWAQQSATWVYDRGEVLDEFSPLQPFHDNTAGGVWTSASAANWRVFGYTYPELLNDPSNETVRATVNTLYNDDNDALPPASNISSNLTGKTYLAAIEAPLQGLDGPYTVQVYLGAMDAATNSSSSTYVGSLSILAQPGMNSSDVVRGSVPLTRSLKEQAVARSGVFSASNKISTSNAPGNTSSAYSSILTSLTTQLHYRVVQNGREVSKDEIRGSLRVAVFTADVRKDGGSEGFPVWEGLVRGTGGVDRGEGWDDYLMGGCL